MSKRRRLAMRWGACAAFALLGFVPSSAWGYESSSSCVISIHALPPQMAQSRILEPVRYQYLVTYPKDCQLRVENFELEHAQCQPPSVVLSPSLQWISEYQAQIEVVCEYRRSGTFFIPPIRLLWQRTDDAEEHSVFPEFLPVTIQPSTEFKPLESEMPFLPWQKSRNYMWIVVILAAFAMLSIAYALYKRVSTHLIIKKQLHVPLNPLETLLTDIALLVDMTPTNLTEYKIYHDRLSASFRLFITQSFGVDAFNLTTNQLVHILEELGIPEDVCEETHRILLESDLVKFALDEPNQAMTLLLLRDMGYIAKRLNVEILRLKEEQENQKTDEQTHEPNVAPEA